MVPLMIPACRNKRGMERMVPPRVELINEKMIANEPLVLILSGMNITYIFFN